MRRFHDEGNSASKEANLLKANLDASKSGGDEGAPSHTAQDGASASTSSSSALPPVNRHRCGLCPKTFLYESDRREHENTHSGRKGHRCDLCDRAYSSEKALMFHRKHAHTGGGGGETHKCKVSVFVFLLIEKLCFTQL